MQGNEYLYKIVLGDWSHDGDGQTEDIIFTCNIQADRIVKAYFKAVKKCKVGLHSPNWQGGESHDTICCKYGIQNFSNEQMEKIESIGVDFYKIPYFIDDEDGKNSFDENSSWAILFMEMAKTQLPDLEYKLVKIETLFQGIGHGLFF